MQQEGFAIYREQMDLARMQETEAACWDLWKMMKYS